MVAFQTSANWSEDSIWQRWGDSRKPFWDPSSIGLAFTETQAPAGGSKGTYSFPILYLDELSKGKITFAEGEI